MLSSPSETSLALYSLEYCLLNLFLDRAREREKKDKNRHEGYSEIKWPIDQCIEIISD